MSEPRFFELLPQHGLSADGNPEPLVSFTTTVLVPTVVQVGGAKKYGEALKRAVILPSDKPQGIGRILPGTRVIEASDPLLASAVEQTGMYAEISKPSRKAEQAKQSETTDAVREAGTHTEE